MKATNRFPRQISSSATPRMSSSARSDHAAVRLAVYNDYRYWRVDGKIRTERAFIAFLGGLADHFDKLVLPGRLNPGPGGAELAHYVLPEGIEFVPLPWYESLSNPFAAARGLTASLKAFWRVLDEVDAVWLLGPHPLCFPYAGMAALRRKRIALGVRQDMPTYARARHPGRRSIHLLADALEGGFRILSRLCRTVVVGPDLAANYRCARRLLQINVSLIRAADLPTEAPARDWSGPLEALSVGRLETEKNPLLLADVLAELGPSSPWRLTIVGEGPLGEDLEARLENLDVSGHADLMGYVRFDGELPALYRNSNALLHVSWTEGVPQVLFEAFAAGLPVVATAVGGVADAVGDAALLIPPGDADAAAAALRRVAGDPELRTRLARRGLERVREVTLESESARVARFLTS
jgi:glycosyltransferase involved in cell wall biosynthesis